MHSSDHLKYLSTGIAWAWPIRMDPDYWDGCDIKHAELYHVLLMNISHVYTCIYTHMHAHYPGLGNSLRVFPSVT